MVSTRINSEMVSLKIRHAHARRVGIVDDLLPIIALVALMRER